MALRGRHSKVPAPLISGLFKGVGAPILTGHTQCPVTIGIQNAPVSELWCIFIKLDGFGRTVRPMVRRCRSSQISAAALLRVQRGLCFRTRLNMCSHHELLMGCWPVCLIHFNVCALLNTRAAPTRSQSHVVFFYLLALLTRTSFTSNFLLYVLVISC